MLFKLKDFQAKAVKTLLENIEAAIDLYHLRKKPITTSLTATTGAGKTVMSAAVIESLFSVPKRWTPSRTKASACYGSRTALI